MNHPGLHTGLAETPATLRATAAAPPTFEVQQRILREALRDGQFRRQLVVAPAATVADRFGIDLGEVDLRVVEETDDRLFMVIPFTSAQELAAIRAEEAPTRLVVRALNDPAFRRDLVADARRVIARELEVELPRHLAIEVLEDDASTLHVVLPSTSEIDLPGQDSDDVALELAEDCGGDSYTMWGGACCTGTCEATANPPVEECGPN